MLLKNGHLVDPSQAIDGVTDIRIENGVVCEVGPDLPEKENEEIFDLSGCYVTPCICVTLVKKNRKTLKADAKQPLLGALLPLWRCQTLSRLLIMCQL